MAAIAERQASLALARALEAYARNQREFLEFVGGMQLHGPGAFGRNRASSETLLAPRIPRTRHDYNYFVELEQQIRALRFPNGSS